LVWLNTPTTNHQKPTTCNIEVLNARLLSKERQMKKKKKKKTKKKKCLQYCCYLPGSDYLRAKPSPSLLKREAEKNLKYSRLITVAQKQAKEKKRLQCPTFNSFIVSDFGDLSPAAIELQEWLVAAYAKKCEREGARADGCNKADMLNVQLAVASGLGGMLLTAGQPFGRDVL
jgi:hypothetical protein